MRTLIIGAGPLGSLYTHLLHIYEKDVTLLARGKHYEFLKENGLELVNEFTKERTIDRVHVIDRLHPEDEYDLVIVLIRKNRVLDLLPMLSKHKYLHNILFMGNNCSGFDEYLSQLPREKVLFGFPGGGGSRIDHIIRFVDSEKPNGKRLPVTIGELDGINRERTYRIKQLLESAHIPVNIVDDIDSWLKYHVAFVVPIAGAILKSGDNYALAKDTETIKQYVQAVREAGRVLKSLGYRKSYNPKFKLFYLFPKTILAKILSKVFNSKFSEIAMMLHIRAAQDEMQELSYEFKRLQTRSGIATPYLDAILEYIGPRESRELAHK